MRAELKNAPTEVVDTTLLDLVTRLTGEGDDEETVVRTIIELIVRGRVRLRGNFRDAPVATFLPT
jgi:hypothetical protein